MKQTSDTKNAVRGGSQLHCSPRPAVRPRQSTSWSESLFSISSTRTNLHTSSSASVTCSPKQGVRQLPSSLHPLGDKDAPLRVLL